ncbi:APC family permease [Rhodopila sp.]|uniref:APC family permease n=1 Tax=Rhodopila sp. TaxID=2480087 RepID=UPI003D14275E
MRGGTSGSPEAPVYRLSKALGIFAVIASAVAAEYGAGVNFVSVQSLSVYPAVQDLAPLAMLVTGVLVLPKVFLYQRYSRVLPRAGSAYVWIGRSFNGMVAFILGFIWWLGLCGSIGVLSFAFGTFLGQAFTTAGYSLGGVIATPLGHIIVGLAAIWLLYWLHSTGVQRYGTFVITLFIVILLTALAIIVYGIITPPAVFVHGASLKAGNALTPPTSQSPASFSAFGAVCTLYIYAYGGISAAPSLGGETRDAESQMPRGIVIGWAVAVVLFSAVTYALFHAAPWWAVIGLIKAHKVAYATAPGLMGLIAPPAVSTILNFAVALIVGKTIAPALLINSRLLFAFGQDRIFPDRFAETSASKVPTTALLLTAAMGSIFLIQSATIGWALGVVVRSLSILLVWLVVALSALFIASGRSACGGEAWARELIASRWTVPAALASVVITLYLMSTVLVVPHTAIWFQPIFQSLIAAAIAIAIFLAAQRRARSRGESLNAGILTVPVE